MQSATNKVIRFGRLASGLGVSLDLVLGAATVALAAVPGDSFKPGKVNIINNATTTLRGIAPVVRGPGGGGTVQVTAQDGLSCDGDDVAIGGGGNVLDLEDDLNGIVPFAHSYQVEFQDNGAPSNFVGFVGCSDSSKPFSSDASTRVGGETRWRPAHPYPAVSDTEENPSANRPGEEQETKP